MTYGLDARRTPFRRAMGLGQAAGSWQDSCRMAGGTPTVLPNKGVYKFFPAGTPGCRYQNPDGSYTYQLADQSFLDIVKQDYADISDTFLQYIGGPLSDEAITDLNAAEQYFGSSLQTLAQDIGTGVQSAVPWWVWLVGLGLVFYLYAPKRHSE